MDLIKRINVGKVFLALVAVNLAYLFIAPFYYLIRVYYFNNSVHVALQYLIMLFAALIFFSTVAFLAYKSRKPSHTFLVFSYVVLFLLSITIYTVFLELWFFMYVVLFLIAVLFMLPIYLSGRLSRVLQVLIGIVLICIQIIVSFGLGTISLIGVGCDHGTYVFITSEEEDEPYPFDGREGEDSIKIEDLDRNKFSDFMQGEGYYEEAGDNMGESMLYRKNFGDFGFSFRLYLHEDKVYFYPVEVEELDLKYAKKEAEDILEKMKKEFDLEGNVQLEFYDRVVEECLS